VGTMKRATILGAAALLLAALPLRAQLSVPPASPRGEMLYATHCTACHSAKVHWRDKRLVTDWASLTAQVGRWQANAGLDWSGDEILDVARYLNATIYRVPDLSPRQQG
jgi:mono/diheme cytochrome c family protein